MTSCSNNSSDNSHKEEPGTTPPGGGENDDDPTLGDQSPKDDEIVDTSTLPKEKITFSVTENSTNAENTMLIFQYTRSAAGAKELVTIDKCGIVVTHNDTTVKEIDKLVFVLDEYGSSFSASDKDPIKNADNMKEYKAKVSLGKKVAKGDEVIVYYNEDVGDISGEGKDADAVKSLVVALIDTDEVVDYYKSLVADENNYKPLFSEKEEVGQEPETPSTLPENAAAIGLEALNPWWDGFEVADKTSTSATITVKKNVEGYEQYGSMCGAVLTFGDKNKAQLKVKNNDTAEAYVKFDIRNDTEAVSAVTAATVDGKEADVQWGGADTIIPAGSEVIFTFTLDPSKEADRFIVGLKNNTEEAPSSGNITISEAYMWKAE